jgi:tetratricopeptide (TPR) repeat protein
VIHHLATTLLLSLGAVLAPQDPALDKAFVQADNYAKAGKFETAVATLRGAGADAHKDGAVRTRFGVFLMRWTEARIQSGDPEVAGLAAVDAWFEVADFFAAAVQLPGATDETFEHWSESLLNANDLGASLAALDEGLGKHKDALRLLLQRGRVLMAQARKAADVGDEEATAKSYAAAEKAFRLAMEKSPKSSLPCVRLGEMKILQWAAAGSTDAALRQEAVDLWTEGARRDPAGLDLAQTYNWLQGDARAPLTVLIDKNPKHVDALWYRGLSSWVSSPVDWPGLRDDLLKVLEINPGFADAYFYLGNGAMRRGADLVAAENTADADDAYKAAARFWAAYLEARGGIYANSLSQAADRGASVAQDMTWLAGRAYGFGEAAQAATIMSFVVQVTPEDGFAWQNFAFFHRDAGNAEKAREAYAKAYELLPEDPQVMNDYAVIHHYYLKDEDELALDLYRRAIKIAQAMLDAGGMTEEDRGRISVALRDATNNLKKLEAGNRRNS